MLFCTELAPEQRRRLQSRSDNARLDNSGRYTGAPWPPLCSLSVGLTPGPPLAGADENRLSPLRPPRLRRVRAGPRVFANSSIAFSSIRLLALALETSKGRLVGQRPAASGGLAPHTRVQAVRLIIFPEEAESLQLSENLLFSFLRHKVRK